MLKINSKLISFSIAFFSYLLLLFNSYAADIKKLIIYHTSDIHSNIACDKTGWLHLGDTIIKKRDVINSLLIDCGDTIPGSIIGSLSKGEAALTILNILQYDAWIIGNHDLEFGLKRLNEISEKSKADIFAANIIIEKTNNFKRWKLYNKNGIKTALIGLSSPHIDKWLWGDKRKPYKIKTAFDTIDSLMPEIIKSQPDVIILAIHHGRFSPDRLKGFDIKKIAETFPQIDLILGGHSHQEIPGEKCGISTWYVESGSHAEKFGLIEISVDTKKHYVVDIKSKLIPAKKNKNIDPRLKRSIKHLLQKAEHFSKKQVGYTKNEISPPLKKELHSTMNELFSKAITEAAKADIAFHGSVSKYAKFAGNITEKDIFNAIPYEDTVCTLELNQKQLEIIIREQIFDADKGRFQSPFGLDVFIDKSDNISIRLPNRKKIDENKKYLCAFSSYILAGAGGRFPKLKKIALHKTSKGSDTGITVRDALRKYIRKHSPLNIKKVERIHYISR